MEAPAVLSPLAKKWRPPVPTPMLQMCNVVLNVTEYVSFYRGQIAYTTICRKARIRPCAILYNLILRILCIFIANLHAIFNDILRKNMGLSSPDVVQHWQWASLSCARVLKFSQIDAIDYF